MKRFIEGENRFQSTLFPESLEDYIAADNSIRVVDAFVDKLNLKALGFDRAEPSDTGRPGYTRRKYSHPVRQGKSRDYRLLG
jgi:transposase